METLVIAATDEAVDPLVELRERRGGDGVVVRIRNDDAPAAAAPALLPPRPTRRVHTMDTEEWMIESSKALIDSLVERKAAPAARLFVDVLETDLDAEETKQVDRERASDEALLAVAHASNAARANEIAAERARLFKSADERGKSMLDLSYRCSEKVGLAAEEIKALEQRRAETLRDLATTKSRLAKLAAPHARWAEPIRQIIDEEEGRAREQLEAEIDARVQELRKFKLVRIQGGGPETFSSTPHMDAVVDARTKQYAVHATKNMLAALAHHGAHLAKF